MNHLVPISSAWSCRWNFEGILPNLPSPGTPAFIDLWAKLEPFGISPEGYSFEVPSSKLADAMLTIRLCQDSVLARLTYSWIEVTVPRLWDGYEESLIEIVGHLHANLREVDDSLEFGRTLINAQWHARVSESTAESYLSSRLKPVDGFDGQAGSLIVDGFAYNLVGDPTKASRIAVAKSLLHEDAIFLDLHSEYAHPGDLHLLVDRFTKDYRAILGLIDLDMIGDDKRRPNA